MSQPMNATNGERPVVLVTDSDDRVIWPDDAKETAYELFAFVCGQQLSQVSVQLRDEFGYDVPKRTLQDWCKRYEWDARYRKAIRQVAPDLHDKISGELLLGSYEAVLLGRKILQVDEATMAKLGPNVKSAVQLIGIMLDKGGFSHLGNRPAPKLSADKSMRELGDMANATVEDLAALEQSWADESALPDMERSDQMGARLNRF